MSKQLSCLNTQYSYHVVEEAAWYFYWKKEVSSLNIVYKSLRGQSFEPYIYISVHGSDPGSFPHFQKPENILDGVYNRVLGTRGSAMTSHTLYSHATG